jgi:hypothetical protein
VVVACFYSTMLKNEVESKTVSNSNHCVGTIHTGNINNKSSAPLNKIKMEGRGADCPILKPLREIHTPNLPRINVQQNNNKSHHTPLITQQ